jgi:NCS1 family nucleobase:cation symporter-1
MRSSKVSRFFDKLAVESEPGLTSKQLMLANEDLKPVEPERRQWGAMNFVAFWISDSFNINTVGVRPCSKVNGRTFPFL